MVFQLCVGSLDLAGGRIELVTMFLPVILGCMDCARNLVTLAGNGVETVSYLGFGRVIFWYDRKSWVYVLILVPGTRHTLRKWVRP